MHVTKFILAFILVGSSYAAPCFVTKQVRHWSPGLVESMHTPDCEASPDAYKLTLEDYQTLKLSGRDAKGSYYVVVDSGKPRPMTEQEKAARDAEVAADPAVSKQEVLATRREQIKLFLQNLSAGDATSRQVQQALWFLLAERGLDE